MFQLFGLALSAESKDWLVKTAVKAAMQAAAIFVVQTVVQAAKDASSDNERETA